MLPARDPAFLARGTLILDGAMLAEIGPVAVQGLAAFHIGEVVRQAFAGGADVNILLH